MIALFVELVHHGQSLRRLALDLLPEISLVFVEGKGIHHGPCLRKQRVRLELGEHGPAMLHFIFSPFQVVDCQRIIGYHEDGNRVTCDDADPGVSLGCPKVPGA